MPSRATRSTNSSRPASGAPLIWPQNNTGESYVSAQSVEKIEPNNVVAMTPITPMAMLAQGIERGMSPETIDKLMALGERWDNTQARKAFDMAIAAAKAEIPVVVKNATGHNSKRYADFAAIARAVDPVISKH